MRNYSLVNLSSCTHVYVMTYMTFELSPTELQTHFGPASECEGAEKEDEVDEEEAEFGPVLAPQTDDSGTATDPTHSTVSTLNSAHSHEHQRSHHQLGAQLGRLKQETNRYTQTHQVLATH